MSLRGGSTILPGCIPGDVFALMVQFEHERTDGSRWLDYHEYIQRGDGRVVDVSRPEGMYKHSLDLAAYVTQWASLPVVEYIPSLPDSVQWNAWEWDSFSLKPGGYSVVAVALALRAYNREGAYARFWWFSASFVPDQPEVAAAQIVNRFDHMNYALVDAAQLRTLLDTTPIPATD